MKILALDISKSCTGIACGAPGSAPTLTSVSFYREDETRGETAARALRWIAEALPVLLPVTDAVTHPGRVVIEAPLMGGQKFHQNPETSYLLGGLAMVMEAACRLKGKEVRLGNVQTVRKHFIGHGNLPGEEAKRRVKAQCLRLGWAPKNYDESDAAALWDWACAQVSKSSRTVQQEELNLKLARAH